MRYSVDHDFHIHSYLSPCSRAPEQTPDLILDSAIERGIKSIVLADHFWDDFITEMTPSYSGLNIDLIKKALPLPTKKAEENGVFFGFGCEADMNLNCEVGVHPDHYDDFDFIVVALNHLHLYDEFKNLGVEERTELYLKRMNALVNDSSLPFHKVGVAHLTDGLVFAGNREGAIKIINDISTSDYVKFFDKTAKIGMGVELNFNPNSYHSDELEKILRPYIKNAAANFISAVTLIRRRRLRRATKFSSAS